MKYSAEQKARLNPEQLKVVEIWEKESEVRADIIERMRQLDSDSNLSSDERKALFSELIEELAEVNSSCPHDRLSTCFACAEIEKLLWPERVCTMCDQPCDPDELDDERVCINCH